MEIKQEAPPSMETGDLTMVDGMSTLALNLSPHGGGGVGVGSPSDGGGGADVIYRHHHHFMGHHGGGGGHNQHQNHQLHNGVVAVVPKMEPSAAASPPPLHLTTVKTEPSGLVGVGRQQNGPSSRQAYLESPSGNKRFRPDQQQQQQQMGGDQMHNFQQQQQQRWQPPPPSLNGVAQQQMNGHHHHHHHHHQQQQTTTTTSSVVSPPGSVGGNNNNGATAPPSPSPMNNGTGSGYSSGGPVTPSNGFPSPMTVSSYDPYSPSGKLCQEELSPGSTLNGFPAETGSDGSLSGGPGSLFDKKNAANKGKGGAGAGSGGGGVGGPQQGRQQEELCLVCGDRASGYHYNALTCEGCKGFFRRSITKNAVYQCKYGNNCEIDMYMRRKCQECRLKKCLNVGMRPECVVPEYQCAVKREAKKAQKDRDKPNSTTSSAGSPEVKYHMEESAVVDAQALKRLSPEQEELINRLVFFQEEFEQPTKDDVERVPEFSVEADDEQGKFRHIAELTILTVQLIVEFSKRLPGFDTLLREDQITLLKACSSEVMMLRTARRYDIHTDSIVFANNQPYTRDQYASSGLSGVPDTLFPFCRYLCLMKVDNAEYALLTAIVVFSERPNLIDAKKVEKIQDIYINALRSYEESKRSKPALSFAKLLAVLPQLRTLGNINSEICFSLKIQNKKIPPFLAEIWDV